MVLKKSRMAIEILKPFGPSIVKLSIPDYLVKKLNEYTDRIILDEEKITKLDHSNQLAGKVKQEFLLENEFMQEIKWGEFLAKAIKVWLQDDSNKELNCEIITSPSSLTSVILIALS